MVIIITLNILCPLTIDIQTNMNGKSSFYCFHTLHEPFGEYKTCINLYCKYAAFYTWELFFALIYQLLSLFDVLISTKIMTCYERFKNSNKIINLIGIVSQVKSIKFVEPDIKFMQTIMKLKT